MKFQLYNLAKVGLTMGLLLTTSACASESKSESSVDKPLVETQYRLQEDRSAFDKLREEVPAATRDENDEIAFFDKLFQNPSQNPSEIRAQFNKALSRRRDKFQKDLLKRRESFVRQERKDRETATRQFEKERQEFKSRKADKEQTKEFFNTLDQKRKDFYANQKEKRDEFEAQMRDDRKNFEDYVREKQSEFNAKLKEFSDKQKDLKKETKLSN